MDCHIRTKAACIYQRLACCVVWIRSLMSVCHSPPGCCFYVPVRLNSESLQWLSKISALQCISSTKVHSECATARFYMKNLAFLQKVTTWHGTAASYECFDRCEASHSLQSLQLHLLSFVKACSVSPIHSLYSQMLEKELMEMSWQAEFVTKNAFAFD